MDDTPQTFWDRVYAGKTKPSGGRPSFTLTHFIEGRPKGRALELGCARGDDAIWLAQQGWSVTGVDISEAALEAARLAASSAGVESSVHFERHDLALDPIAWREVFVGSMPRTAFGPAGEQATILDTIVAIERR